MTASGKPVTRWSSRAIIATVTVMAIAAAALSLAWAAPGTASANIGMSWGGNGCGQLGNGTISAANNTRDTWSELPVPVSSLSGISAVSAGGEHSLALLSGGSVDAWGCNQDGQLGDGNNSGPETCGTSPCSRVPIAVSGLSSATAISAGGNGAYEENEHSLALISNGTVKAWGDDEFGQLGVGKAPEECKVGTLLTPCSTKPETVKVTARTNLTGVIAISAGGEHSLALLSGGTVDSWGANRSGQLGDGSKNGPEKCALEPCAKKAEPIGGLSNVTAIAAGGEHSLALLSNGTVEAWGANEAGQLGDGTSAGPETCGEGSEAHACSRTPVAVSGLSNVIAIAAGAEFSLALLSNGTVEAWGANEFGELGDGTFVGPETCGAGAAAHACSKVPVAVSGLSEVAAISAGGQIGLNFFVGPKVAEEPHSIALLKNGTVKTWGANGSGELGDGTLTDSDEPVTVTGLSGVEGISAGGDFDLAFGPPPAPPTVTGVSPKEGPGGSISVEITGTNLTLATAVKFGSASASYEVNSDTSITAVSPPGSGTVDVTVTTPGGTSATSEADRYTYVAPTVTGVSPERGSPLGGTSVTITGTRLIGATAVKFGANNATIVKVSETSITAVSPAGSGIVDVTVTTPAGTSPISEADQFSYLPLVSGVSPKEGPLTGGSVVTITGANFIEVSAVKFGSGNAVAFKVESESSITAVSPPASGIPPASGTVDVTVTTLGGTSPTSAADKFTYGFPGTAPVVAMISPKEGPPEGGTTVTITGVGFNSATAVKFGSVNASSYKVESESSITAVSPPGTGTVHVTVTNPAGTSTGTPADEFTY
jgi:alpha-tubulin suppressor-like RCC1 family protein